MCLNDPCARAWRGSFHDPWERSPLHPAALGVPSEVPEASMSCYPGMGRLPMSQGPSGRQGHSGRQTGSDGLACGCSC